MGESYHVLGQISPSASTLTTLYTVPASTSTTVSSLLVCNTNSTSSTFRISIQIGGASDTITQYLYYDIPIQANDTFAAVLGITLATTDVIMCQAGATNVAFNVFGVEIS